MHWSHDTCQLMQRFCSHVHSRACQMWRDKHSQIVQWFYLLSTEVRVFVGRWAVKIQNRWRTRCCGVCRCSLISENCYCFHWCDFLLHVTRPSGCGALEVWQRQSITAVVWASSLRISEVHGWQTASGGHWRTRLNIKLNGSVIDALAINNVLAALRTFKSLKSRCRNKRSKLSCRLLLLSSFCCRGKATCPWHLFIHHAHFVQISLTHM